MVSTGGRGGRPGEGTEGTQYSQSPRYQEEDLPPTHEEGGESPRRRGRRRRPECGRPGPRRGRLVSPAVAGVRLPCSHARPHEPCPYAPAVQPYSVRPKMRSQCTRHGASLRVAASPDERFCGAAYLAGFGRRGVMP